MTVAPFVESTGCDPSLWRGVYTGDRRRFAQARDRLQVIRDCVTVTNTIEWAHGEPDGDFHIRLRLDPPYAAMINDWNIRQQHGDLVLEPVCVRAPTQDDTVAEHVCDNFHQNFDRALVGQHVRVVGAYVTDMEHHWTEIHPVTGITLEPN